MEQCFTTLCILPKSTKTYPVNSTELCPCGDLLFLRKQNIGQQVSVLNWETYFEKFIYTYIKISTAHCSIEASNGKWGAVYHNLFLTRLSASNERSGYVCLFICTTPVCTSIRKITTLESWAEVWKWTGQNKGKHSSFWQLNFYASA